jgi:hypothetical protein
MIYGYLRISARKKCIEFLETLVEASAKVKKWCVYPDTFIRNSCNTFIGCVAF